MYWCTCAKCSGLWQKQLVTNRGKYGDLLWCMVGVRIVQWEITGNGAKNTAIGIEHNAIICCALYVLYPIFYTKVYCGALWAGVKYWYHSKLLCARSPTSQMGARHGVVQNKEILRSVCSEPRHIVHCAAQCNTLLVQQCRWGTHSLTGSEETKSFIWMPLAPISLWFEVPYDRFKSTELHSSCFCYFFLMPPPPTFVSIVIWVMMLSL